MQTVIITGTSSGLGKALFDFCVEKNQNLICIARTVLDYQGHFEKQNIVKFVKQDLTCLDEKFFHRLSSCLNGNGHIDKIIFVNNAGIIDPIGNIGFIDNKSLKEAVNINFIAPVAIVNFLTQYAKEHKVRIKFINISSGAANYPIEGWGAYCSTKAATKMFLSVLKKENDSEGIEVIDVDPGVMDTVMQVKIRKSDAKQFPKLDYFCRLKSENKLKSAEEVALKIGNEFILS